MDTLSDSQPDTNIQKFYEIFPEIFPEIFIKRLDFRLPFFPRHKISGRNREQLFAECF